MIGQLLFSWKQYLGRFLHYLCRHLYSVCSDVFFWSRTCFIHVPDVSQMYRKRKHANSHVKFPYSSCVINVENLFKGASIFLWSFRSFLVAVPFFFFFFLARLCNLLSQWCFSSQVQFPFQVATSCDKRYSVIAVPKPQSTTRIFVTRT